jgi:hypothetical protein
MELRAAGEDGNAQALEEVADGVHGFSTVSADGDAECIYVAQQLVAVGRHN